MWHLFYHGQLDKPIEILIRGYLFIYFCLFLSIEFLLDILFIYISNLLPFTILPSGNPIPSPLPISMKVLPFPTTPDSPPWHSPTLEHWAFIGPRASPLIDAQQDHPLLHIHLEQWFTPCVLFGWWFCPWELLGSGWTILFFLWGLNNFIYFSALITSPMESPYLVCCLLPVLFLDLKLTLSFACI